MKIIFLLSLLGLSIQVFSFTVDEGKKTLMPFKKELMGTLMGTMKKSGPVAAVEVCHLQAIPITKKHGAAVIGMGRTSHKLRNPKNAPRAWVRPYLEQFKLGKKKKALTLRLRDGHTGYLEPIYIQAKCLVCHGENISKSVAAVLKKNYPYDQAKGFKVGDFRGLFWLEVAK